ncbi:hypothetical protein U0070_015051, partial [Myodes glareolus]
GPVGRCPRLHCSILSLLEIRFYYIAIATLSTAEARSVSSDSDLSSIHPCLMSSIYFSGSKSGIDFTLKINIVEAED